MTRNIVSILTAAMIFAGTAAAQDSPVAPPAGVDPALTSPDPKYGHTLENPVKVGSREEFGGPAAQRAYLESLRDEHGEPVTYKRQGSAGPGPGGSIVDLYEITTSTGKRITLYLDMYHPDNDPAKQPAPAGLFKAKP